MMEVSDNFTARGPDIYHRETPKKDWRCRVGWHFWSSLDWRGSTKGSVYSSTRMVARHCLFCGKAELYHLDPDE